MFYYVLLLIQTLGYITFANTGRPTHTRGTRSGFQVLQWFHFHLRSIMVAFYLTKYQTCSLIGARRQTRWIVRSLNNNYFPLIVQEQLTVQVNIARVIRTWSFCLFIGLICSSLSNPVIPFDTLYSSREGKEEKKKQA